MSLGLSKTIKIDTKMIMLEDINQRTKRKARADNHEYIDEREVEKHFVQFNISRHCDNAVFFDLFLMEQNQR